MYLAVWLAYVSLSHKLQGNTEVAAAVVAAAVAAAAAAAAAESSEC